MRYYIKKNTLFIGGLALLILLQLGGCTKKDVMPSPVGEEVIYKDTAIRSWKAVMDRPGYTCWKAAWNRSGMNALLTSGKAGAFQTVFMPSDKAFQAAGWTIGEIAAASPETLDSLLGYHLVAGRYAPDQIAAITGSQQLNTVLNNTAIMGYSESQPYIYKLFAAYYKDSLLVNGITVARWGTGQDAADGYVYTTDVILPRPVQTMWDYIENNPQFSLFKEAMLISNNEYLNAWGGGIDHQYLLSGTPGFEFTLFAPTNKAFEDAGFHTAEDIQNYVNRSLPLAYPDYDQDWYYQYPKTAIDSILMPHGLEAFDFIGQYEYPLNLVFFTNDLVQNGPSLSGMVVRAGQIYNNPPGTIHLDFSAVNGQPRVKRYQTNHTPLPLVVADIRVLNGVIHVVDGLFMP